jgi:hypothetical protein
MQDYNDPFAKKQALWQFSAKDAITKRLQKLLFNFSQKSRY